MAASIPPALGAATRGHRRSARGCLYLGVLRRAFSLGRDLELLQVVPRIVMLPRSAPRSGFTTDAEIGKVVGSMPPVHGRAVIVGFETGMRIRSEVLALRWPAVDLERGWLYLWAGTTKTGAARAVPMTAATRAAIEAQAQAAAGIHPRPDYVFCYVDGRRSGRPLRHLRYAWRRAVVAAGLPDLHMHDLRRSCARRLAAAGVSRTIAQRWLGHRSPAVHDAYACPDEALLLGARDALDANRPLTGHSPSGAATRQREGEAADGTRVAS